MVSEAERLDEVNEKQTLLRKVNRVNRVNNM